MLQARRHQARDGWPIATGDPLQVTEHTYRIAGSSVSLSLDRAGAAARLNATVADGISQLPTWRGHEQRPPGQGWLRLLIEVDRVRPPLPHEGREPIDAGSRDEPLPQWRTERFARDANRRPLRVEGNEVELEIMDNGRGLPASGGEHRASLGMVGMRARARQLGGELIVENRKEGGLRLKAEVPLQEVDPDAKQEDPSFVG